MDFAEAGTAGAVESAGTGSAGAVQAGQEPEPDSSRVDTMDNMDKA